jgi:ATP-binding cassette subfamily B protein
MSMSAWQVMHSLSRDGSVADTELPEGTARRVLSYARPMRSVITAFLALVVIDSVFIVAAPLLMARLVDHGVIPRDRSVVVTLAVLVAGIALLDAIVSVISRWYSARIGEGLIFNLRREVFSHVVRQPIAFFTRAQTGALVSRVNNDVIGAQQAFTTVLSSVVGNLVSLVLILGAMIALSWKLTVGALLLVPLFLLPARWMGRRLAALSHEQMNLNAEMGTRMTERFNVGGALLVKLFGNLEREDSEYAARAARVRDIGIKIAMNRTILFVALTLIASLATAMVYGFGGLMAIDGSLTVGTLIALAALLARLYGPLTTLSNVRVDIMTALVSFSRVFEILDLVPAIREAPHAQALAPGAVKVDVEHVGFSYPGAEEVSLTSLEVGTAGDRRRGQSVLTDISFHAAPGEVVALVGPSGGGKTTITNLLARLYDPTSGQIRLQGIDLRDATLDSLSQSVGVVTQDSHLFHDTIRANLLYARAGATEQELRSALASAQILHLIDSLPQGLDTVVGDRGYRLSGGEKQRIAIARLLLKAPGLLVLDEATAHLDSESELAVQQALDSALAGRTAIIIAHRLSTIRRADQILVIQDGRIVERGRHHDLLAHDGLYADLYRTQFQDA